MIVRSYDHEKILDCSLKSLVLKHGAKHTWTTILFYNEKLHLASFQIESYKVYSLFTRQMHENYDWMQKFNLVHLNMSHKNMHQNPTPHISKKQPTIVMTHKQLVRVGECLTTNASDHLLSLLSWSNFASSYEYRILWLIVMIFLVYSTLNLTQNWETFGVARQLWQYVGLSNV